MNNLYEDFNQLYRDTITFIYSNNCIEPLKNMVKEMSKLYHTDITLDDICYYGIFCDVHIYANYKEWGKIATHCNVPEEISDDVKYNETQRLCYVKKIIDSVMKGEIVKPKWMVFVEAYKSCNVYNDAPSTFLYLLPKEEKYKKLCERFTDFLYSTHNLTDLVK